MASKVRIMVMGVQVSAIKCPVCGADVSIDTKIDESGRAQMVGKAQVEANKGKVKVLGKDVIRHHTHERGERIHSRNEVTCASCKEVITLNYIGH